MQNLQRDALSGTLGSRQKRKYYWRQKSLQGSQVIPAHKMHFGNSKTVHVTKRFFPLISPWRWSKLLRFSSNHACACCPQGWECSPETPSSSPFRKFFFAVTWMRILTTLRLVCIFILAIAYLQIQRVTAYMIIRTCAALTLCLCKSGSKQKYPFESIGEKIQ